MLRRILLFGFGVLLSIIIISSFSETNRLKETIFAYVNYFDIDKRVLYHLRSDTIFSSVKTNCLLKYYGLTKKEVLLVLENGKVNFDKSQTEKTPCQNFVVEDYINQNFLSVHFEYCANNYKVSIIAFEVNNQDNQLECN